MICHSIGRPPISTIGLGLYSVSSRSRVPSPPARITTFIDVPCGFLAKRLSELFIFIGQSRGVLRYYRFRAEFEVICARERAARFVKDDRCDEGEYRHHARQQRVEYDARFRRLVGSGR